MLVEKSIQIIGGKKLTGTIEVSGAKNAVLKQMILPILSEGVYKIENVPNIADVYYMQEVLDVLGIKSKLDKKTLEINSPSEVRQRTWERGSGETWACGTGASAVCVSGVLTGKTDRRILNHLLGGDLELEWDQETNHVFMTGPATEVYSGEWDLA